MLKREWGAESNEKLPHLSIPSKTAVWVPELAVKDLPLSRTAALVPEFAVKYSDDDDDDMLEFENTEHTKFQFKWSISFRDINF